MVDTKESDKYKVLLSERLKESEGRNVYSGTEVRDILLDLWLALNADVEPSQN